MKMQQSKITKNWVIREGLSWRQHFSKHLSLPCKGELEKHMRQKEWSKQKPKQEAKLTMLTRQKGQHSPRVVREAGNDVVDAGITSAYGQGRRRKHLNTEGVWGGLHSKSVTPADAYRIDYREARTAAWRLIGQLLQLPGVQCRAWHRPGGGRDAALSWQLVYQAGYHRGRCQP